MNDINYLVGSTDREISNRTNFFQLFKNNPIPDNELLNNLGLFISRQNLSRMIFIHELYYQIIPVHGVVMEFGVRWGQNLALFESLRGMYEPFNHNRKIVGFDTFAGFPQLDEKDGTKVAVGDYGVTSDYEIFLTKVLEYHESESPIPQMKKFELVKGDATTTIEDYLERHKETIIALAYFDFDIYLPTQKCLKAVMGHVTKGTVLAFDELNCHDFPGETIAVKEVLGLDRYAIRRSPLSPACSYIVVE